MGKRKENKKIEYGNCGVVNRVVVNGGVENSEVVNREFLFSYKFKILVSS
jgi:hypothetical protein